MTQVVDPIEKVTMTITLHKVNFNDKGKLTIRQSHYDSFQKQYLQGVYVNKRFGEAFYEYFKLEKLKDQTEVSNLFAKDGEMAKASILSIFDIIE